MCVPLGCPSDLPETASVADDPEDRGQSICPAQRHGGNRERQQDGNDPREASPIDDAHRLQHRLPDQRSGNSQAPSAALIDVRQVVKSYSSASGSFTALKGVSLQVQAGEFIAVVGKSGSGKSKNVSPFRTRNGSSRFN